MVPLGNQVVGKGANFERKIAMTVYAQPGQAGAVMDYKPRYDHWIGGQYVAPSSGQYFENPSPVTGRVFTEVARGNAADIDKALKKGELKFVMEGERMHGSWALVRMARKEHELAASYAALTRALERSDAASIC